MFKWIKNLINKIKQELAYRKRLKELKKKDPFIYKQMKAFDWLKKTKLIEMDYCYFKDDPVRPELDNKFRKDWGRKIFGLKLGEDIIAVMCFAFTHGIPKDIDELNLMSKDAMIQSMHRAGIQGDIAVAYTVWSKKKGGGKRIVQEVFKMVKKSNHLNRLVTLSPLTDMARKFHLRNGAKELQVNKTSQNFEYTIENEWWENYLKQAKKWFKLKR